MSGAEIAVTLKRLMKAHSKFYWAVAWGSENSVLAELLQHQEKITKLVVGTHFYQTPPEFLGKFENIEAARVMSPDGATFHPKTYLFVSSDRSALVVGSANFTQSAMAKNVEACCLIEGASGEQLFQDTRKFITSECWGKATVIDADFLRDYRIQHAATKDARAALKKFAPLRRPKPTAKQGDPLEMSWTEFAEKVRSEKHFQKRLKVLATARVLLDGVQSFSKLSQIERKAIAGTLGRNENGPGSLDWGLFGSMFGFGVLKKRINENSSEISDALDCIPPTGPVDQDDYDRFVKLYVRAFRNESRVGGIPSASRLLAMKRPDFFVCIDKANKTGLSAHFGLAASAVNLENYWTDLIEPIRLSPWWRALRGRGVEGKIWDGRAAFLDALFYEGV
jgi:HKD family nuclease